MNEQTQVQTHKKVQSKIVGTRRVKIADVDPLRFGNPRAMTDRMRATLTRSIDDIGYVQPVLVREVKLDGKTRYETLDGHHRFDDIKARGESEIDVLVVDVPDDKKARKLALALNKISSDWTPDKLDTYVEEMLSAGIDAADILATTGFTGEDLEQLARAGTAFLDDFANQSPSDDGDGGAAPGTQQSGDRVKISLVATPKQHATIFAAIKTMRSGDDDLTAVEALARVCALYQKTVKSETVAAPEKRGRKKK